MSVRTSSALHLHFSFCLLHSVDMISQQVLFLTPGTAHNAFGLEHTLAQAMLCVMRMQVAQLLLYFRDDLRRAVHLQLCLHQDGFMYNKNRKKEGVHLPPPQRQSCQQWELLTQRYLQKRRMLMMQQLRQLRLPPPLRHRHCHRGPMCTGLLMSTLSKVTNPPTTTVLTSMTHARCLRTDSCVLSSPC